MKPNRSFSFLSFISIVIFFTFNSSCTDPEDNPDGSSVGTVKDIDGNQYKTIKIGTQVWMTENLKTTRYNDGTDIPNVISNTQWSNLTTGAYCNYDNLESNATKYGRLYNWHAVSTGKLAPAGWHVPTDVEWTILENYLIANGHNYDGTKVENKIAKSLASTTDWQLSSTKGTPGIYPEGNNSTGFSALPAGYRNYVGTFSNIGNYGLWWSSIEDGSSLAWYRHLTSNNVALGRLNGNEGYGFSVWCIRD